MLRAPAEGVPYVIESLHANRERTVPLLRDRLEDASLAELERLHAALALAALGDVRVDALAKAIDWAPRASAPT